MDSHFEPSSLEPLRAKIASARNYVRPSDNLRPRTLEAAQDHSALRRGRHRLLVVTLLLILTPNLMALGTQLIGDIRNTSSLNNEHLHEVPSLSHRAEMNSGWGLLETFLGMRRDQATRLGVEDPKQ